MIYLPKEVEADLSKLVESDHVALGNLIVVVRLLLLYAHYGLGEHFPLHTIQMSRLKHEYNMSSVQNALSDAITIKLSARNYLIYRFDRQRRLQIIQCCAHGYRNHAYLNTK